MLELERGGSSVELRRCALRVVRFEMNAERNWPVETRDYKEEAKRVADNPALNVRIRQVAIVVLMCLPLPLFAQEKEIHRLADSYLVLHDVIGMPDKGIPRDLLNKRDCRTVDEKGGVRGGRQVRTWCDDPLFGGDFPPPMERSGDVCAGRRKFRLPSRRRSDGLGGHEREGRTRSVMSSR